MIRLAFDVATSKRLLALRWLLVTVWALSACTEQPLGTAPDEAAPVISRFAAAPAVSSTGSPVGLSWQVSGAESLTLWPDDVDVTGQTAFVVAPRASTTYRLVAENRFGSSRRDVRVEVREPEPIPGAPIVIAFSADPSSVPPGGSVTLSWVVDGATSLELRPGGLDVSEMTSVEVLPTVTTIYVLAATNSAGTTEVAREVVVVTATGEPFAVLVAGQSNAQGVNLAAEDARDFIRARSGVQMLGNDYVWKDAYEPLDDCVGQVDLVSMDPASGCSSFSRNTSGVSFGVSLGNSLSLVTGGPVYMIPAALGGSSLTAWRAVDADDTSTLFGSAITRARLAETQKDASLGRRSGGDAYGAVVWYQGESETTSLSKTTPFVRNTGDLLDAFERELGAPIVLVQLSRRGEAGSGDFVSRNLVYQKVREQQRLMTTGARQPTSSGEVSPSARDRTYLVVTHDLPMSDGRHLSAEGQVELGRRIGLAIRAYLWGEATEGSGPRLERVTKESATVIQVHADRALAPPATSSGAAYGGYFAVFADGAEVAIASIGLEPGNDTVIRITLARAVSGTPQVRYMPPPGTLTDFALDVVRAASCDEPMPGTTHCLPMPAFGFVVADETMQGLRLFYEPDVVE